MPRPPPPSALPRRPVLVLALALATICVLVEAALWGADAGLWGNAYWRPFAYQHGAFWAGLLYDWRPNYAVQPVTMFLSYAFLHGGVGHLLGNMAALLALIGMLGPRLDLPRLAVLWVGSGIGGGAAFAVLIPGPMPMVGASGALFGLAGAWMVWEAAARRRAGRSRGPVWRSLAVIVALHPVLWVVQSGLLAWQTHLGGLIAGVALAWALGPAVSGPPSQRPSHRPPEDAAPNGPS